MFPPTDLSASPAAAYKDSKTGLVLFGLLTILMGGVCALFVPLMMFGQAMSSKASASQSMQTIVPAIGVYGLLAVILIWLGVGSMMARRWARALLLIYSWSWLIVGLLAMVMMAFVLPGIMESAVAANGELARQPPRPPVDASAFIWILMIIMGVIFVILPAAWVFFYQSRHVKATCEARDPVERWTDRCPLPVIAVCLWLAVSGASMLIMPFVYKGVIPVFGMFVVGPLGSALYVLFAVLWGYCAWAMYKLDPRGWWLVMASVSLASISAFITYSRHDMMELYALMGYPEEQMVEIRKLAFLKGQTPAWIFLGATLPMLGYLLYLRRYFVRAATV